MHSLKTCKALFFPSCYLALLRYFMPESPVQLMGWGGQWHKCRKEILTFSAVTVLLYSGQSEHHA